MTRLIALGNMSVIDREKQVVKPHQLIHDYGYGMEHSLYMVGEIEKTKFGYLYHLINTKELDIVKSDIIRPLSEKFGIGRYYNDTTLEIMPSKDATQLIERATAKAQKEQKEEEQKERLKQQAIERGKELLKEIVPENVKSIILAELIEDQSDAQRDFFYKSVVRTVILGFSDSTRNNFAELRRFANNFEPTAELSIPHKQNEHRENYSGGRGYYLGASVYSGWIVRKRGLYNRQSTIENFAYTAGSGDNIYLGKQTYQSQAEEVESLLTT